MTVSHVSGQAYDARITILKGRSGFDCDCRLCRDDRRSLPAKRAERQRLNMSLISNPAVKILTMPTRGKPTELAKLRKLPNLLLKELATDGHRY